MAGRLGARTARLGQNDALGVDEIAYNLGHKYLTLVYQIEAGMVRLQWVGKARTVNTFRGFFDMLGADAYGNIKFICSDMWRPQLRVIRERYPRLCISSIVFISSRR
jgi:transposase